MQRKGWKVEFPTFVSGCLQRFACSCLLSEAWKQLPCALRAELQCFCWCDQGGAHRGTTPLVSPSAWHAHHFQWSLFPSLGLCLLFFLQTDTHQSKGCSVLASPSAWGHEMCIFHYFVILCLYLAFQASFSKARAPKGMSPGHGSENPIKAGLTHLCELSLTIKGLEIIPHSYSLLNAEWWMCCLYPGSR